jgi:predicted dehydrogenase
MSRMAAGGGIVKTLNVAIIGGSGFMGKAHSLAWALAPLEELGVRVVKKVLVDIDERQARVSAESLGWEESATSWEEVVARDDIDIVDIVTPPAFHMPVALGAIAHGKHVFCEKPVTPLAEDAERMWVAARDAGVVNQVGFCYRHAPAVRHARELIAAGTLGVPLQLRSSYLMDYAFSESAWGRARGAIGSNDDIGTHIIDTAQFLLGDIVRVSGRLRSDSERLVEAGDIPGAEGTFSVDDAGLFLAEFESGAVGTFSHSLLSHGRKNEIQLEIDASRGALDFDWNHRDEIQVAIAAPDEVEAPLQRVHVGPEHAGSWWPQGGMGSGYLDGHVNQLRHFVTCIVDGTQAHPNFGEAAQVQRVANAVQRSSTTGTWVEVEPLDPAARR